MQRIVDRSKAKPGRKRRNVIKIANRLRSFASQAFGTTSLRMTNDSFRCHSERRRSRSRGRRPSEASRIFPPILMTLTKLPSGSFVMSSHNYITSSPTIFPLTLLSFWGTISIIGKIGEVFINATESQVFFQTGGDGEMGALMRKIRSERGASEGWMFLFMAS